MVAKVIRNRKFGRIFWGLPTFMLNSFFRANLQIWPQIGPIVSSCSQDWAPSSQPLPSFLCPLSCPTRAVVALSNQSSRCLRCFSRKWNRCWSRTGAANDPSPVEPEQQSTAYWRLPVQVEQRMTHLLSKKSSNRPLADCLSKQRMTHLLWNRSGNRTLGDYLSNRSSK